jgi:hypothetical protein
MDKSAAYYQILQGDCLEYLDKSPIDNICLSFLDPPFRQGKDYRFFDDGQPDDKYWAWLKEVLSKVYKVTTQGGAIYFMQREKTQNKY